MTERERDIIASIAAGESQKALARRYGITPARVHQVARAATTKAMRPVLRPHWTLPDGRLWWQLSTRERSELVLKAIA